MVTADGPRAVAYRALPGTERVWLQSVGLWNAHRT
jgi:hypothetical protein